MVGYSSNYPFLSRAWARFYKETDHVIEPKIPPVTSVGCKSLPLENKHNCWDKFWSADADVTVRLVVVYNRCSKSIPITSELSREMTEWAGQIPARFVVSEAGFQVM